MRISDWSSDVCSSDLLPLLFAAQFSPVHAGWMVAYPLAGWSGAAAGFGPALIALCALAALGLVAAWHAWPAEDPQILAHRPNDLRSEARRVGKEFVTTINTMVVAQFNKKTIKHTHRK